MVLSRPILWFLCGLLVGCSAPPPLKIGFVAGLTGPASELGVGARRALDLSVAALNKKGGLRGRLVELVVMDDGNTPEQGLAAYQRFEKEGVVAVIGPMASTVIGTVLPFLNEHRLLTVSPTVSASSVEGRDDWFFRVITSNQRMGEALGHYAVQRRLTDVAVLRETSNDAYTRPILAEFRRVVTASGARVHEPVEFDLRTQPDYSALARRLGSAGSYLVLANGYDSAQIGQKLALAGGLAPILGPPWAMTPDVISLGGRQVERMVFVSVYDSESRAPGWLQFREEYQRVYGNEPGFASIYAQDSWTLLVDALTRTQSWEPEALKASILAGGEIEGLQSSFHLDPFGDVVRDLFFLTVREGRFVRAQL